MEIMYYILYGMVIFCFAAVVAIIVGVFGAAVMDWNHKRRYGAWEVLKGDGKTRRRPAAK